MNIDKRWLLLLAAAAGAGAATAVAWASSRRQHHRTNRDLEHTADLKSWENEGGNLAPAPSVPILP
jgi:fatty-acid desaturase